MFYERPQEERTNAKITFVWLEGESIKQSDIPPHNTPHWRCYGENDLQEILAHLSKDKLPRIEKAS